MVQCSSAGAVTRMGTYMRGWRAEPCQWMLHAAGGRASVKCVDVWTVGGGLLMDHACCQMRKEGSITIIIGHTPE